tara:strand:- start:111 stop:1070 length:960 start_codon:yes stop_codon:yes gene_type:complete
MLALSSICLSATDPAPPKFDAIIVAGGGIDGSGLPLPWVLSRLDAALNRSSETEHFLTLSRGTTHEPPPLDMNGFPIDEAQASTNYLVQRGIDRTRIVQDTWSLDTIGNAAFARLMHAEPRRWKKMLVITSDWHMARTRAIFDWIFSLPPQPSSPFELEYHESPADLPDYVLQARVRREAESLAVLQTATIPRVTDLVGLHQYIFSNHSAYAAGTQSYDAGEDAEIAASYKGRDAADDDPDISGAFDNLVPYAGSSAARHRRAASSSAAHVLAAGDGAAAPKQQQQQQQRRQRRQQRARREQLEKAAAEMWRAVAQRGR